LKQQRIRRPASLHIRAGGRSRAIVITSSTAGLYGGMADGKSVVMGYVASSMASWA
jgi:hypothetical protein